MIIPYIDAFVEGLIKGVSFHTAQSRAWRELTLPRNWSTVIWLAVLLLVFVTMQELSRVIGKDQMKYIFRGDGKSGLTPSEALVEQHEYLDRM